jgi:hypothetical protein
MTTLLFVMGFLVLAVAGLGFGLWQMARIHRHGRRAAPPELAQPAPRRSYGPMARLFDGRDLQFLQAQSGCRPGMTTRLRLQRRKVLSLYLRQVRADFRRSWAASRALAPWDENPEFGSSMAKQFLTFYGLYAVLQFHCLLGWFFFVRTDVGTLLAVAQRAQQRARQAAGERSMDLPAATTR